MPVDMTMLFERLQRKLAIELQDARAIISHPTDKGTVSEVDWIKVLKRHIPSRYCIEKATVIDCDGNSSESIDMIIYDRQYSPIVFEQQGFQFVPAEAVYAVFEVKQTLNRRFVNYACEKARSVRRLRRTSVAINDIRGVTPQKVPFEILSGLLATDIEWKCDITTQLSDALNDKCSEERLDLICAAEGGAFNITYPLSIQPSRPETGLAFFIFELLSRLQKMGTVAPIDFDAYRKWL